MRAGGFLAGCELSGLAGLGEVEAERECVCHSPGFQQLLLWRKLGM